MAQKKITALIFDMDGLIFDSERVVQRSKTEENKGETYGTEEDNSIDF